MVGRGDGRPQAGGWGETARASSHKASQAAERRQRYGQINRKGREKDRERHRGTRQRE